MISITVDTNTIEKGLDDLARSQLPFATSKAINEALKDAQQAVITDAKTKMTIRRERFLRQSYKITKFAKKNDLTAQLKLSDVGGKDTSNIFQRHEEGTDKTAKNGGNLAIPTRAVRTNKAGLVQKGQRPRNLKNSFKSDIDGKPIIAQRTGSKKNPKVTVKWLLRPLIRIKKRLDFDTIAPQTFNTNWNRHISAELDKAIASAQLT